MLIHYTVNEISIRAPTRGATHAADMLGCISKYFNPRSHEGSDMYAKKSRKWRVYFNPRSHEGSDFKAHKNGSIQTYFNPRSHEGSDYNCAIRQYSSHDFNPRSHEGSDINFHQKVLFSLSKNCLIHLFFITNFLN